MIPRGIRNCNPLNIRRSKDQWKGLLPEQNDKSFFQFKAMEWGYRAAFRLLRTYRIAYRRTTVRTIIERWAPPSENQTRAYIGFVCEEMGVPPNFILHIGSLDDDDTYWACELVRAMALVENGNGCANLIRREEIKKGYQLAFEPPNPQRG
ncbi:MAG: hypothetical protein J5888_06165 [Bacteroidaceae bacterium]|nr:hypothetical protein [Bacteroidaceae bacterium]